MASKHSPKLLRQNVIQEHQEKRALNMQKLYFQQFLFLQNELLIRETRQNFHYRNTFSSFGVGFISITLSTRNIQIVRF
jgi:hypothetical protein